MKRLLLPLLAALALPSAFIIKPLQANDSVIYLILSFSRDSPEGTHSSVAIPVRSMEECKKQGNNAITKNTKEVRTRFWCIPGVR